MCTAVPAPLANSAVTHSSWARTDSLKAVSFEISLSILKSLSSQIASLGSSYLEDKRQNIRRHAKLEGGGKCSCLGTGKIPTQKWFLTCFHSKRTSHLKGLCERSSPTLPHTSGWFVPAATPCSKGDKNLPSSTCMKRPSPTDLPTPWKCPRSAPLSAPGARWWRGEMGEGESTAPQVCQRLGARGTGNVLFRDNPWGESGLPPLLSNPEPSQSKGRWKQQQKTWVSCAETWAQGPGKVGAS